MNYILFDGPNREALLPFTYTRPVADIRIGILTIREKWELFLGATTTTITEDYLSDKFPMVEMEENIMINSSYLPSNELVSQIKNLSNNQVIYDGDTIVAFYNLEDQEVDFDVFETMQCEDSILKVETTWDIFSKNAAAIIADFELITAGRTSAQIPERTEAFNTDQIFIEEGAQLPSCILNATNGPIYIGKNTEIMEGSLVRGPFALCEGSILKMGAKIYGPTTIGPYSKVGGEVNNSVFFGNSNKAHDGFLGNSVIGEWCNLGADTNNSNLKNNYSEVKIATFPDGKMKATGSQFVGVMMGDHTKTAINTSINTGSVFGVMCTIATDGFPPKFLPNFSWLYNGVIEKYHVDKAVETIRHIMSRRNVVLSNAEISLYKTIFENSVEFFIKK